MTETTTEKMTIGDLRDRVRKLGLDVEEVEGPTSKAAGYRRGRLAEAIVAATPEPVSVVKVGNLDIALDEIIGDVPIVPIPPEAFGLAPDIALDDIHWRIDSKPTNVEGNKGRARYISYIDRNVAASYLDGWLGPDGWEDSYTEAELAGARVLWCHLSLHFPDRTVVRSDLSTFSSGRGGTPEERQATGLKGLVSDAFKRAASKAGVGRNVYRLPEVWAECRVTQDGKAYPTDEAMEQIAAKLRKAGHSPESVTVPDTPGEDEPEAPADWTLWAKNRIWHDLGQDDEKAGKYYRLAIERTGIYEPFPGEQEAAKIVGAAGVLAIADELPGETTVGTDRTAAATEPTETRDANHRSKTRSVDPDDVPGGEPFGRSLAETAPQAPASPASAVEDDGGDWVLEGIPDQNDPQWAYEVAGRRAALGAMGGDVGTAKELFESMTGGDPHPLDRASYAAYRTALTADVSTS